MFHVELRQFPHVAHAFNLSAEELDARIVAPWVRGDAVELGDRRWDPGKAKLTIVEGSRLRSEDLTMGRGWSNARRGASEVTDRLLASARQTAGAAAGPSLAQFKDELVASCDRGRIEIHQVLWLAHDRHRGRRPSERLALAEQAIWELLHEGRIRLLRPSARSEDLEQVPSAEWQPILLSWVTWADPRAPSVYVEATEGGPGVAG
jgi:hypothetical protein